MPYLELRNICKSYGAGSRRHEALRGVNLSVGEGEFVAIVGFSGGGKTTLVSVVAGLIEPDSGEVLLHGKPIKGPGPDRGVVFQNYSLLPWLTARQNVALAVGAVHPEWTPAKRDELAETWLAKVNLGAALDKRPRELSGGMRQRVSVARALSADPEMLLLDEPLSALDALTRASLQDEIERLWRVERKTVLLITNDVDEGVLLADRVLVLSPGPGAEIVEEYTINLPRPRDRKALNHDPEFRRLRNAILLRLRGLSPARRAAAGVEA